MSEAKTGWLATKPIHDMHEVDAGVQLHRTLSATSLVALGIGAVIGTGIFVLTGVAAAQHAGPALVLSFLLAAVGCAFAGLCYAELAAMIPVSGSAYSYSYATLGEFFAWFIGWDLILEYGFAISAVAVGWSGYVNSLLNQIGIHLPAALVNAPLAKGEGHFAVVTTDAIINLPAMLGVGLVTWLCYIGIRQSSWVNNVIVIIKLAVILLFIGFGAFYVSVDNWTPFIPENVTGEFGKFGWSGVAQAAAIIFFAYIGFDAVSTTAQEAKNPQRDMPIGILVSLAICTVLYIAMAAVMTGMVPYTELNVPAPVAVALDHHPELSWLAGLIKLGAIAGITSVLLVMTLGQPRIFFAMSRDGLLPPLFQKVHPKYKTPHVATLITGGCAAIIAGLLPIGLLGELVSIGTLLAFVMVCLGVLALRYTKPDQHRPFKVPAPWFTCLSGVAVCGFMMYSLPIDTWIRLLVWTVLGFIIYLSYGRRHSVLRKAARDS
ncbi:MAG: amino acid permease [Steroidobacteraceae bacterium]